MSRNNTGNPIGSKAFPDFEDNVKNLDVRENSRTELEQPDRFGVPRKTWHGIEVAFNGAQDSRESEFSADQIARASSFSAAQSDRALQFNNFIASSGYSGTGADGAYEDYAAGITLTQYNQVVRDPMSGDLWRVSNRITLPYATDGSGLPENDSFVPIGDAALRQQLSDPNQGAAIIARSFLRFNSISEVKSYSAPPGWAFFISDGPRSGVFEIVSGNYSAQLSSDRNNGIYIGLADDPGAATKVARRVDYSRATPEMFGAKGDGSDDTDSFNAAIEFLNNQGGGELYLSGKNYLVSNVVIRNRVRLRGQSTEKTIVRALNGSTGAVFIAPDGESAWYGIGFTDMQINGNFQAVDGVDFRNVRVDAGLIQNVLISDCNTGIHGSTNDRQQFKIVNSSFVSCVRGYHLYSHHPYMHLNSFIACTEGIYISASIHWLISDCLFTNCDYGMRMAPGAAYTESRVLGCRFTFMRKGCLDIGRGVQVSNCQFSAPATADQDPEIYVIKVFGSGSHVKVENNYVEDTNRFPGPFIWFEASAATCTNVSITGNTATRCGGFIALAPESTSTITLWRMSGNSISGSPGRYAMLFNASTFTSCTVIGNTCRIGEHGFISTNTANYCNINDNTITANNVAADTISIGNSEFGNNIQSNTINSNQVGSFYAIAGDLRASIVSLNNIRRTMGIDQSKVNADSLILNNVYHTII